eukprot:SAG31_NODE_8159_length_1507_cov_0.797585_2_plen_95_part_00
MKKLEELFGVAAPVKQDKPTDKPEKKKGPQVRTILHMLWQLQRTIIGSNLLFIGHLALAGRPTVRPEEKPGRVDHAVTIPDLIQGHKACNHRNG